MKHNSQYQGQSNMKVWNKLPFKNPSTYYEMKANQRLQTEMSNIFVKIVDGPTKMSSSPIGSPENPGRKLHTESIHTTHKKCLTKYSQLYKQTEHPIDVEKRKSRIWSYNSQNAQKTKWWWDRWENHRWNVDVYYSVYWEVEFRR